MKERRRNAKCSKLSEEEGSKGRRVEEEEERMRKAVMWRRR